MIEYVVFPGSDPRFAEASDIRRAVFIDEQGVPEEEELDSLDAGAAHILCLLDGKAAGTLRFYDDSGWLHVGRVAVLPSARSSGLGRGLMLRCLEEARRAGFTRSFLNAQCDKRGFYQSLGYSLAGGEFMEAGIPHCRMELEPL